jgi:hypothetical protein
MQEGRIFQGQLWLRKGCFADDDDDEEDIQDLNFSLRSKQ